MRREPLPPLNAACDTCGLTYWLLAEDGRPCLRQCGGHIWRLPCLVIREPDRHAEALRRACWLEDDG